MAANVVFSFTPNSFLPPLGRDLAENLATTSALNLLSRNASLAVHVLWRDALKTFFSLKILENDGVTRRCGGGEGKIGVERMARY